MAVDPVFLLLGVPADGEASSPYPDWLPQAPSGDRPLIYADFANGHYWAGGAISTLTDIFVENSDVWGSFDPATVVGGKGLGATSSANNAQPVISDTYVSELLAGYTTVMTSFADGDPTALGAIYNIEQDFLDETFTFDASGEISPVTSSTSKGFAASPDHSHNVSGAAFDNVETSVVAINYYLDHIVMSAMGQAPQSATGAPGGTSPTLVGITVVYGNTDTPIYLATVAFYAPQPDIDLPTLSTPS